MTARYPANIVTTAQITTANPLTSLSANNHSTKHDDLRDEIIAVETYLGKTASTVAGTVQNIFTDITGSDQAVGKIATQTVTNKTLGTGTKIALGSDVTGDTYYNSGSTTVARRGIGSEGQVMTVVSGVPNWQSPTATNGNYIADTGAANAYVATLSPALSAYTAGVLVQFKATNANTTTSTVNVNGLGVKTIKKLNGTTDLASGDIAAGQIVELEYDGTNFQMLNPVANLGFKFGGDGTDGALTISSGTTNIDLASSSFVVKNYTSIAITGTGKLTFTNPATTGTIIVLKSQGAVTLTSSQAPMIDASVLGGIGGAGVTSASSFTGIVGSNGLSTILNTTGGGSSSISAAGAGGTLATMFFGAFLFTTTRQKYSTIPIASGGGSGGGAGGTSSNGGRGGGSLIIECAGVFNFTTASGISVAGSNGGNGSTAAASAGGSGGGAGGYFLALYNSLTANTGTVTVTAGIGGLKDATNTTGPAYGGGGGALLAAGSTGTATTLASAKTGGDGAIGVSLVVANNDFN